MGRNPKAFFAVALGVCVFAAASPAVHAWWVPNGTPIATLEDSQDYSRACADGMGGAIIVYYDNYAMSNNISAQRVSASGNVMWDPDGVMVCWVTGAQYNPVAIPDGAGGAFVAWQDERDGTFDIYVQRLSPTGTSLWQMNGQPICTAVQDQEDPCIVADGGGGAIVAWRDNRNGNYDIFAQRVNANGTALWTANGVSLCTAAGSQAQPRAISDGAAGAIVTWGDPRTDVYDIYAQKVDRAGLVRWTANGVALCTAAGGQYAHQIVTDGAGGAIVAWRDLRSVDNVYAQRVNSIGAVQWALNGIALYATTDYQGSPRVVSDNAGGAIVTWYEYRKGEQGIFAQRVNGAGTRLWTAGGVIVEIGLNELYDPNCSPDGLGGMIITWMDDTGGDQFDLFACRLTPTGLFPWGKTATVLSDAIDNQKEASIAPIGDGGAVIAWTDGRNGGYWHYDIYAQHVDPTGRMGWIAPEIASVDDVPGDQGGRVFLAWDAARPDRYMEDAMSHYTIWRSIGPLQAALAIESGAARIASLEDLGPAAKASGPEALSGVGTVIRVDEMGALATYWELIDTQEALFMEGYAKTETTLYDSSAACGDPTYFQVIAHTTDLRVYFKSDPDSGWSVDNLAPGAPAGFAGERVVAPAGLALTWDPNVESDLSGYALYRGTSADFVPGAGNLLGRLDETEYFDGEWNWGSGYFYKLSAIDVNGNESPYALFSPDDLTGVDTPTAPAATYLAQNFPNPFNPTTRIAFGLAAPARVSLRIYDASGRLVRMLAEGARPAGAYAEMWDGRDSRGASVASGIYFYRLEAGAFSQTRKMALLR